MKETEEKKTTATAPTVSIVVTAYNVEPYIEEAVSSAMLQSYRNVEIVVVDDHSTDRTPDILSRMARADRRIRIVTNAENVGAGLSRRTGITASTGQYVLLLDGDDWLSTDFIASLLDAALTTGAEMAGGGITVHQAPTAHLSGGYDLTSYGTGLLTDGMERLTFHRTERIQFMNNKLIARRLHRLIPYCHRRYIEDTPVIFPMLWEANALALVDNAGYHYRMQPASLTHTASPLKTEVYRSLCADDLARYFAGKGEPAEKLFTPQLVRNHIANVVKLRPTAEQVAPFGPDWADFGVVMCRYLTTE